MKFRKKPVVIDAFKWEPEKELEFVCQLRTTDIINWILKENGTARYNDSENVDCILINTLEGTMKALPSDWIIKGIRGEFYPCKPDIFQETYEIITDE